jgi:hypothetical protein
MTVAEINSWLRNNIGKNLFGQALYRVVFSDDQTEKRFGTFNDFHGNLFIRSFTGVREVKKYPYIVGRYVFERWFPPELTQHDELIGSEKGSYEPIYVFETYKGEPLPVTLKICQFLVRCCESPQVMTPQERMDLAQQAEDAEIKEFVDTLTEDSDPLLNALHMKEAIGYTKEIKDA